MPRISPWGRRKEAVVIWNFPEPRAPDLLQVTPCRTWDRPEAWRGAGRYSCRGWPWCTGSHWWLWTEQPQCPESSQPVNTFDSRKVKQPRWKRSIRKGLRGGSCYDRLKRTSYVLLEVVRLPLTPCVAMTARMLSPSTRSLYLFLPLCSSMWMTARATSGIPCTTTFGNNNSEVRKRLFFCNGELGGRQEASMQIRLMTAANLWPRNQWGAEKSATLDGRGGGRVRELKILDSFSLMEDTYHCYCLPPAAKYLHKHQTCCDKKSPTFSATFFQRMCHLNTFFPPFLSTIMSSFLQ